jgi:hypothetical protein
MISTRSLARTLVAAPIAAAAGEALAQEAYPSRIIHLVVGFPAGQHPTSVRG